MKRKNLTLSILLLILMLVFLFPFFLVFMNSFKTSLEISQNILSWPETFTLGNYKRAWEVLDISTTFVNTLILAVIANSGLVILGSMAGYWLSRHSGLFHSILFGTLIAAMAIPFETVMIPLVKVATNIHMVHSVARLGVCYWGMGASTYVFMVCGAVKTVPIELEESACIDGYGPFRTFWKIVFPLLKATTVTMVIINTFWVWNDYLMPQLFLGSDKKLQTIQLAMRSLFLEYYSMWDIALAGLVISLIPTVCLYLMGQRFIISGITAGAMKG